MGESLLSRPTTFSSHYHHSPPCLVRNRNSQLISSHLTFASAPAAAAAVAVGPALLTAKWVAQYDSEGTKTYVNSITDEVKDSLTAAEQEHLLPELDPYNNKLIMSLKVCNPQTDVNTAVVC
jgi:hypothetical protein